MPSDDVEGERAKRLQASPSHPFLDPQLSMAQPRPRRLELVLSCHQLREREGCRSCSQLPSHSVGIFLLLDP